MRVFAISDLHVDHPANADWVAALPLEEHQRDVLILAGDVSHALDRIARTFEALKRRFAEVLFTPGNHDLWVQGGDASSFEKFDAVVALAEDHGVSTRPYRTEALTIIPLFSWYDGSFGAPSEELRARWRDYRRCDWSGWSDADVTAHFLSMNQTLLTPPPAGERLRVVSFSHFLPRVDLMPMTGIRRLLRPVLGAEGLDAQIRAVGAQIHVYGHSHVNRQVRRDGRLYVNNALGGPQETHLCARRLQRLL